MTRTQTLVRHIAGLLAAIENCQRTNNAEWSAKHKARLTSLLREFMPSGSGIDNGTHIMDDSKPERLRFRVSFHHMNDSGCYDGWTDHTVTVRPSFVHGMEIDISGRDRNDIKEYLADTFRLALESEIVETGDGYARADEWIRGYGEKESNHAS